MDKKDGKKKESIDEILSDLNGLLNKMPSILDGIKMPEIKPVEFTPPAAEKKPEPAAPPAADADKTVVLQPFSGLAEGAPEPQLPPAADAGDKTVILENFSSVPEGGQAPEESKLVPQSLGDFMFGEETPQKPENEAEKPEPVQPEPVQPEPAPEAAAAPDFPVIEPESPAPAPAAAEPGPFETTRDFGGIPDIDALLQLSDAKPAPETPAAEPAAPAPAAEQQPSVDELAEFEKQLASAAPQPEEAAPAPAPEQAAPGEVNFEALTIEPAAQPAAVEAEALRLEPQASAEPLAAEPLSLEPQTSAAPQQPAPMQFETPFGSEKAQEPPAAGGIELSVAPAAAPEPAPASDGMELSLNPRPEAAVSAEETLSVGRPEPGLVLEPASAVVSGAAPSGDETLVVPPPAGQPEEEKTVIFEAGAAPGITSRSQAGDLAGLAGRQPPEGLPAERIRSLAFLYAPEDKALCATVLAELDSICLKSPDKPMFVKRASVSECDPNLNGNYIMQTVTDSGAQGLICVGAIPQEKIYEVESVFTAANGFFRHYDSSSFTRSAALDLVLDIILR